MKKIYTLFLMATTAIGMHAQTIDVYRDGQRAYSFNNADSVLISREPLPIAKFSVSESKQVSFSSGNLQYTRSTATWSFAEHQYDIIGAANVSNDTLADTIDLFGWSSTNGETPFGVSASLNDNDYVGGFVDWGTNTIGNYNPDAWHWRTLKQDEWNYLFNSRPNAEQLKGVARINLTDDGSQFVNGLILLPDDWTCPKDITFKSGFHVNVGIDEYADYQTFTIKNWITIESSGAVFLPAAGVRYGASTEDTQRYGYYWSSTPDRDAPDMSCRQVIRAMRIDPLTAFRRTGCSVRLVHDVNEENISKEPAVKIYKAGDMAKMMFIDSVIFSEVPATTGFSVSDDKQIVFSPGNLQYTQSTQTWSFAAHQYEVIGANNLANGALSDKIDLFGWSADNNAAPFGVSISANAADYAGTFVDWGKNTINDDAPDSWHTLTPEEWNYLLVLRPNAAQLKGVARINLNDDGSQFVNGLILLPDGWTQLDWVTFYSGQADETSIDAYGNHQTLSLGDWLALESSGAVFLPACGSREGTFITNRQTIGTYWTTTDQDSNFSLSFTFTARDMQYNTPNYRHTGLSVRLVKQLKK